MACWLRRLYWATVQKRSGPGQARLGQAQARPGLGQARLGQGQARSGLGRQL
jgi:hypothetical protein